MVELMANIYFRQLYIAARPRSGSWRFEMPRGRLVVRPGPDPVEQHYLYVPTPSPTSSPTELESSSIEFGSGSPAIEDVSVCVSLGSNRSENR